MAEGWARRLKAEVLEFYSAGVEVHGMNQNAIRVMAETGSKCEDRRGSSGPLSPGERRNTGFRGKPARGIG